MYARNRVGLQVGSCPSDVGVRGSNLGFRFFFVCHVHFSFYCASVKICTMIEVSSEQSRSQFYMLTECCCRCCCCCCSLCCYTAVVAAATVLVLPAAVRHRVPEGQVCCCFIESDPSVLFLFIQTRFIFYIPLGSTVVFTASIYLRPR